MSNPIEQSYEAIQQELASVHQRNALEAARKLTDDKEDLDTLHATNLAIERAKIEREVTLDWAWSTAEFLNESGVQPEYWNYEHTQESGLFGLGRRAVQGIAAEGWQILDWQNTHYRKDPKHVLILTPNDEDHSGIHLSYFSHPVGEVKGDSSHPLILPSDVHVLSRIPLSPEDMPWPEIVEKNNLLTEVYGTNGPTEHEVPWTEGRSLTFSAVNYRDGAYDLTDDAQSLPTPEPSEITYESYRKRGIESTIRNAIVQVAAKYISLTPQAVAERARERHSSE